MIDHSAAYAAAITADTRRVYVRAVVDISGPDKRFLPVQASPQAPWSRPEQLHDHDFNPPPRFFTLEPGRTLLDGSFDVFPDDWQVPEPVGYAGLTLSGMDGTFETPQFAEIRFERVRVLQTCSVFFSTDPADGVPEDFRVEVYYRNTVYFSREVTGNRETQVSFQGFTVWDPTAIRITVTRWSLPGRRMRLVEIMPGLYEEWGGGVLAEFSVTQQGQFSSLSLPYGTMQLSMDNQSRRFEPRRKDGIFQSIEERQGVEAYIGVRLENGAVEYQPLGVFYQAGDGWKTGDNGVTQKWSLVDIIGLLTDRTFLPPEVLPSTLAGWLEALVVQLGENFRLRWHCDPDFAEVPVIANSVEDVTGKKCGEILRWVCMASGTWIRARSEDGALTAEPLWNQGNKLTLDNLEQYPAMKANTSIAALIFQLADGAETELVVPGNQTASEQTVTVKNPFIHTPEEAFAAARVILSCYGGNIIETTGRGDPAGEIGDVDTIWLDKSNATTARRMSQTLNIQNGVLRSCKSTLLQADGSYLYENRVVITKSGEWTAPEGVTQLWAAIGQGGTGGMHGQPGYIRMKGGQVESGYGEPGTDGSGGKVWWGTININPSQKFSVQIGVGGKASWNYGTPGTEGEETTFGPYSSAEGTLLPLGYTDINSGDSFARTGVPVPLDGTGDGGKGGDGGEPGIGRIITITTSDGGSTSYFQIDEDPGPGYPGADGANGFVVISWDKPQEIDDPGPGAE